MPFCDMRDSTLGAKTFREACRTLGLDPLVAREEGALDSATSRRLRDEWIRRGYLVTGLDPDVPSPSNFRGRSGVRNPERLAAFLSVLPEGPEEALQVQEVCEALEAKWGQEFGTREGVASYLRDLHRRKVIRRGPVPRHKRKTSNRTAHAYFRAPAPNTVRA